MTEESEVVEQEEIPATTEEEVSEDKSESVENEETQDAEEKAEGEVTEESQPQKPKKKGAKERINELTRERYEEQRKRTLAEQEANELRERMQQIENQQFEYQLKNAGPTIDQFETQEQFQQAYAKWFNEQQSRRHQAQLLERQKKEQAEAKAKQDAEVSLKLSLGQEKYEDFQQVISNPALPSLPQTNPVAFQEILGSNRTDDLLYYLGKNPAEAHRISAIQNPFETRREVYKLESKLTQAIEKPAVSSAPPPIGKIEGKPPAPKKSMEDLSTADWMKARNKQIKRY